MNITIEIQNEIHQVESRIEQIKNSSFYSDDEKKVLVNRYAADLEQLYLKKAHNTEVINPEVVK